MDTLFRLAAISAYASGLLLQQDVCPLQNVLLIAMLCRIAAVNGGQLFGGVPRSMISGSKTKDIDIQFKNRNKRNTFLLDLKRENIILHMTEQGTCGLYGQTVYVMTVHILDPSNLESFISIDLVDPAYNCSEYYDIDFIDFMPTGYEYDFGCNTLALDGTGKICKAFDSDVSVEQAIWDIQNKWLITPAKCCGSRRPDQNRVKKMNVKGYRLARCKNHRCWSFAKGNDSTYDTKMTNELSYITNTKKENKAKRISNKKRSVRKEESYQKIWSIN
jgi:hypothetical protein